LGWDIYIYICSGLLDVRLSMAGDPLPLMSNDDVVPAGPSIFCFESSRIWNDSSSSSSGSNFVERWC